MIEKFGENINSISEPDNEKEGIPEDVFEEKSWFQGVVDSAVDKISEVVGKTQSPEFRKKAMLVLIPLEIMRAAGPALAQEVDNEKPKESTKVEHFETKFSNKTQENLKRFSLKFSGLEGLEKQELKESIGQELDFMREMSEVINKQVEERTGKSLPGSNFDDRAVSMIEEAERFRENLPKEEKARDNAIKDRRFKILDTGKTSVENLTKGSPFSIKDAWNKISLKEFGKALPVGLAAFFASVVGHEYGHMKDAERQRIGGEISFSTHQIKDSEGQKRGFFGGLFTPDSKAYSKEGFDEVSFVAAGIEHSRKVGDFLTNLLRAETSKNKDDQFSPLQQQIVAMLASASKANGALYAYRTNFMSGHGKAEAFGDIMEYSKATKTKPEDIFLGLTAAYVLSPDNWKVLQMAFGDGPIEFSDKSLDIFYELNSKGPKVRAEYQVRYYIILLRNKLRSKKLKPTWNDAFQVVIFA